jgi:predicted DNA binding CopG/RHH family protein
MPADAFIQCRVTSDMKALVKKLAEREGITESRLVKHLLETLLRTAAHEDVPAPAADKANRDARLYVCLGAEDRRLLKERSGARGLASATYVALSATIKASQT